MKPTTLLTPHELDERSLAAVLEQQFGAAWFPEYHRWNIESDDAAVFIDANPEYGAQLPPDERRDLAAQLGFVPHAALSVQPSAYHLGSPALAERVLQSLCRLLDGRALAAA